MKEHLIYKYVYKNEVIYIGKTDSSLYVRIKGHEKEEKFKPYLSGSIVYYFRCNNRAETTIYETALINKYKPLLNVQNKYNNTRDFELKEPEWIKIMQYSEAEEERIKDRGFNNAALSRINGVLTGHCIECGKYLGNEHDTKFFSLIRKKYCNECAKKNKKEKFIDRKKRYKSKQKTTMKEMRRLLDIYKVSDRLQKEVIESLERENKKLKAMIDDLERSV